MPTGCVFLCTEIGGLQVFRLSAQSPGSRGLSLDIVGTDKGESKSGGDGYPHSIETRLSAQRHASGLALLTLNWVDGWPASLLRPKGSRGSRVPNITIVFRESYLASLMPRPVVGHLYGVCEG